ncbi:putative pyrethroid hydrolase [Rosellinia necatrix]|uniref:Putative pyrethroid hydrolase n=1 Tax=Rosellinia necatrix TaxID=77044 RepID=A0A1W2TWI9_ROSNE|nr:putative pyrethroid hydrolase [Rosellinia necatrix]
MSPTDLPTILLVPGAFGKPEAFDPILPYLEKAGFVTRAGPYPSFNPADPYATTYENDTIFLHDNVLLPLLEQRKDVIVLAHSYGGVVAAGAVKDLDKQARRAEGHVTGVIGLIYIAGNIMLKDESLLGASGGHPPFIKTDKPSKGLAVIEPAMEILYNDCDPALESEFAKHTYPHSLLAFATPATAPGWADKAFDGRRAYVRTLKDNCNPSWVQDAWLEKSKVQWDVIDFDTGHMPFISQPEALAATIVKVSNGFRSS